MAADETVVPANETCAQCHKTVTGDDRVAAGDRVFCQSCHTALRMELETAVETMSVDVPYASALVGALLGGAVGVAAWWAFTVATKWSIGIIAIGVGYAVGWGTVRFAGGKRSRGLQIMAAGVALASWVAASYLVNRTFVNRAFAEKGETFRLGVVPASLEQLVQVLGAGFGIMDVVFLAIMVWEAWKAPKPFALPAPRA
ncbi:MAG: LIM domain-containing protein [Candidatus Eisenbacteria bacterium]